MNSRLRSYRITNIAILCFILYCLMSPFLFSRFGECLPSFLTKCPSRLVFHRPCPLCGASRALLALARLDIATAMSYNPLALPLLIFALMELSFRVTLLAVRFRDSLTLRIARFDLLFHLLAGAVYLGYAGFFVAKLSLSPV